MAMSTRKKVEIPDKAWLETLKFLMGPQWQKMRFVSHQLAEVVRNNISELPRIIIDNVKFSDVSENFNTLKHSFDSEVGPLRGPHFARKRGACTAGDWVRHRFAHRHQYALVCISMPTAISGQIGLFLSVNSL
ncbi:hypothetical protein DdX_19518 [Ditylenchus destructor]|uniref:Uncharacterized protein n=1 Tax=Ditylenchus destructor TaxID=166010 RepID=A0AAD4MHS0_9BILA|nr:hypothetical protein DdX_19518 [Ditylenchus destructor]